MNCLGLIPGGSNCLNSRDINYGDYCKICYKKGLRPNCPATSLNGNKCPYKAKSNGYCGNHVNYEERKRKNAASIYSMTIENEEIVRYTKEEYDKILSDAIINKLRIEEIFLYRQQLLEKTISCKDEDRLFIITNPDLIYEWNFEKNIEIGLDIKKITQSSGKKPWWKCSNKSHETFTGAVYSRTKGGSNCKECRLESLDLSKEKREKREIMIKERVLKPEQDTTTTGDNTEKYVADLISSMKKYKSVEIVGNMSGKADIKIIQWDNSERYIQVKTLSLSASRKEIFSFQMKKYPDNILIVAINKERDRFVLEFSKRFKDMKGVTLSFNAKSSKYKNIMYTDLKLFKNKLVELIPFTTSINLIDECAKKEDKSLRRLKEICKEKKLEFKEKTTNGNTVDCYINGFRIQAKFRKGNNFNVEIKKSGGTFEGKRIRTSYQENDFDFLIVEFEGEENEYLGNFCIIPMSKLVEKGLIRTDTCQGKKSIKLCSPDSDIEYWSKEYWNAFDLLSKQHMKK